jgi:hypothetical protein
LEAPSHHRYARNRRAPAPDWFSYVLATNFQSQEAGWKKTDSEGVRELIFRMVVDNPSWGAPRIHGELLMLGFELSERTASRSRKRAPRDPDRAECWLTFLHNHREAIAAMDFFTVPTITFGTPTHQEPQGFGSRVKFWRTTGCENHKTHIFEQYCRGSRRGNRPFRPVHSTGLSVRMMRSPNCISQDES